MKKQLEPEVLALIPNGIHNLTLHCFVCGTELPEGRRRSRFNICGPACRTVWFMYSNWLRQTKKCLACLRPSTPEERKSYRAWRKATGQMGEKRGPKRKKTLDNADVTCVP